MATRKPRFMAGGPDEDEVAAADPPKRLTYPCAAHGCPMPGSMFLGGASDGVCGWHGMEPINDWPRITDAIHRWECVSRAINRARRVLTAPETCADPKAQDNAMREIWAEMLPAVQGSGWKQRVQPRVKGPEFLHDEHLGEWARRLNLFLGARVKESMQGGSVDETQPTLTVAEMRKGMRTVPLAERNNLEPFA